MGIDRIAVIGISGSGKSTFARALAVQSALPLLHGDQLEWTPNWSLRADGDLKALHEDWITQPRWIIEGWIDPVRTERLNAADLVIDLDLPGWLCAARVLARMVRGARRAEMPEGCVDRWSWRTLKWVALRMERPFIDSALRQASVRNYVRLRSPRQAEEWLKAFQRTRMLA